MTDETTLQQAMKAADAALVEAENTIDHLGACAVNVVIEAMWVMHRRQRMVGADFKAARLIHRTLTNLAPASIEDHRTDSAPAEKVERSPMLDAMDRAANDAEATKLAAQ